MFIENATTGSQSIQISQGSGASVTILAGKTAVVYLDGAGSGAAVVDAMAGVDPGVTDTLAEVLAAGNTTTTDQKIQFRDTGIYINSSVDGQLDIVADTEIQIAATTIDINGAINASGEIIAASLDISGDIDVDGTTNLDVVDIDGAVNMASTALVTGVLTTTAATVFNGGFASNAASTITSTANGTLLTLQSSEASASSGPDIALFRDSASPADDDALSNIFWQGKNSVGSTKDYMKVRSYILDVTDGTEDFGMDIQIMTGGNVINALDILPTELVINNGGIDRDFRVESSGNANMLFVDGGENAVGIGTIPPAWRGGLADVGFNVGVNAALYDQTGGGVFLVNNWYRADDNTLTYRNTNEAQYMSMEAGEFSFANAASGSAGSAITFTERMKIDASGGLITNPAAGGHAVFNEGGVDADFRVESDTQSHMLFVDASTNRVGINNSSPSTAVDIGAGGVLRLGRSDNARHTELFHDADGTTLQSISLGDNLKVLTAGGNIQLQAPANYVVVVNEDGVDADFRVESDTQTHALFVDAGTNSVGIADSAPGASKTFTDTTVACNFFVNSNVANNGPMFQYDKAGVFLGLQNDVGSGTRYFISFGETGTRTGDITSNGSVMTYGGTSDYRLKTNVQPMTGAIDRVKALNPVTFDWISSGISSEGFIAHELQSVIPDAATGTKDEVNAQGKPVYQQVDPRHVVSVLTAALQEAIAKIETLEARIATLEAK
jgi:cytoskeletal protein CcmA (bactofilin family)